MERVKIQSALLDQFTVEHQRRRATDAQIHGTVDVLQDVSVRHLHALDRPDGQRLGQSLVSRSAIRAMWRGKQFQAHI